MTTRNSRGTHTARLALCCLALLGSVGAGAQDVWIPLTSSPVSDGAVLAGSFALTRNNAGAEIGLVTGREVLKEARTTSLQRWYVTTADCIARQGKLVGLALDGQYIGQADFVLGSGTVAATKAEFICKLARAAAKKK